MINHILTIHFLFLSYQIHLYRHGPSNSQRSTQTIWETLASLYGQSIHQRHFPRAYWLVLNRQENSSGRNTYQLGSIGYQIKYK